MWKKIAQDLATALISHPGYDNTILASSKMEAEAQRTETAAFHLHNRKARRELTINVRKHVLPFSTTRTYLGVKLDSALTFRQHLE